MNNTLISFFVLGLTFGWGPCLVSCGPVIISYIAGTGKNIPKALYVYSLFSITRIFVYLVLGPVFFFFGNFLFNKYLSDYFKYVFIAGGIFIVLTGLLLAVGKRFELKFCRFLQKNILEHDKKSAVIFGLMLGVLPCASLLAIFSLIVLTAKDWFGSLLLSLSFGIGTFFSPLLLLAIFAGSIPLLFKNKSCLRVFNLICGMIMAFLGVQLIRKGF